MNTDRFKRKLLIISGPSGVGKGTVIKQLIQQLDCVDIAISATTRLPRNGEVDGVDYYFYTQQVFDKKVQNGDFIEYCNVHGNHYGTLNSEISRINSTGKICVLEIDTQGAKKIKKALSDAHLIFLKPPSIQELQRRLEKRGSETNSDLRYRLDNAVNELNESKLYDFVLINDNINVTVKRITDFISEII